MPYLSYFANTKEPVIGFADEFGQNHPIVPAEAFVAMKFDGINSKADIAKYLKKQIKAGKFRLDARTGADARKKDDELIKIYIDDLEKFINSDALFEYFSPS